MENILFIDATLPALAEIKQLTPNTIRVITEEEVNTSGFCLITDDGSVYGEYKDYTTLYCELENGFILSNDGSVYVEPEAPKEIEIPDYIPSLEYVQDMKISEMNAMQQQTIYAGVDVTLSNGSVEHFTLSEHDQISLMGLQTKVLAGEENIPWHTSDETESCKFYSNADMALITNTALTYITWHVTYFRDLRIYIRSLETKDEIALVTYGMDIPVEYQSEPLKTMIAAISE